MIPFEVITTFWCCKPSPIQINSNIKNFLWSCTVDWGWWRVPGVYNFQWWIYTSCEWRVNEIAGFGEWEFQECMKHVRGSPELNMFCTVSIRKYMSFSFQWKEDYPCFSALNLLHSLFIIDNCQNLLQGWGQLCLLRPLFVYIEVTNIASVKTKDRACYSQIYK